MAGTQNVVVIANKIRSMDYTSFGVFAQGVHDKMLLNAAIFTAPIPLMPALQTDINTYNSMLAAWGAVPPHGSKQDFLNLQAALHTLRADIANEAAYVQALARQLYPGDITNQKVVVSQANMRVKNEPTPLGSFTQPRKLRQIVKNKYIGTGLVYLRWQKPAMGSLSATPNAYIVMSSNLIGGPYGEVGVTGKTWYVTQPIAPGQVKFYQVVPVGAAGNGAASDPCSTMAQ